MFEARGESFDCLGMIKGLVLKQNDSTYNKPLVKIPTSMFHA